MPIGYIVAELNAVTKNVELYETANDASCLASLQLFANSFTYDLHIDAGIAEQNILVLAQVGSVALVLELFLADWLNLAYVAYDVAVAGAYADVTAQERIDGCGFLFLLFGVCLGIVAGVEDAGQKQGRKQYEWCFLHRKIIILGAKEHII